MTRIIPFAFVAAALTVSASGAFARADCPAHPKSEWIKQDAFKEKLISEGYQIRKFKVDDNCYELYGKNKDGKKVEIYFDTVSGQPVKSNIEK